MKFWKSSRKGSCLCQLHMLLLKHAQILCLGYWRAEPQTRL